MFPVGNRNPPPPPAVWGALPQHAIALGKSRGGPRTLPAELPAFACAGRWLDRKWRNEHVPGRIRHSRWGIDRAVGHSCGVASSERGAPASPVGKVRKR
eukprot:gene15724-biopygen2011